MQRFKNVFNTVTPFFRGPSKELLSTVCTRDRETYIGFGPVETMPIHGVLKKGFQHCFVFFNTPMGIIRAELLWNIEQISIVDSTKDINRYIRVLKRMGVSVLKMKHSPERKLVNFFPWLKTNSCVNSVLNFLGMKIMFCYTPWVLYQKLLKLEKCKEI